MANQNDLVFKKIVNRQYTDFNKKWYEENPGVPFKLKGSDVWIDNIPEAVAPGSAPAVDSAVIKGYRAANRLVLTHDTSVASEKSWYCDEAGTKVEGFVSPRYGKGYTAKLFAGATEITTTHTCGWFFDYESGNVTFDGVKPAGILSVEAYLYTGATCDDLAEALEGSAWQDPVISFIDVPAGTEVAGDRFLIGATPTGIFVGHANEIAEFDGVNWKFSPATNGKITYVVSLDRLYVYDFNDGWAWSGIDAADLDYNNADSDLDSLSVKDALDELDRLAKTETTNYWVDSNRVDAYVETGSIIKPFKTLAGAMAIATVSGSNLNLAPGTYDGAAGVLADNVSLIGTGMSNTIIANNLTFGTTSGGDCVLENVNFSAAGSVVLNGFVNVKNVRTDGSIEINGKCIGSNLDIDSDIARSALLVNGPKVVLDLLTVTNAGDALALEHTAGSLIISTSKVLGNRATEVALSSGGSIETSFTAIENLGAGKALEITNGALVDAPNKLYDTIHVGGIECNASITIVEGVNGGNPTSTELDNLNLIYRGGTQLKNDSTIIKDETGGTLIGKTVNDAVDRVAQVSQYDATHGFLIMEPCIDDIT